MVTTKYAEMTKDEAIKTILQDYPDVEKAMSECFREGFLRGEQFAKEYYPCKEKDIEQSRK
jgi:hypothetical protein